MPIPWEWYIFSGEAAKDVRAASYTQQTTPTKKNVVSFNKAQSPMFYKIHQINQQNVASNPTQSIEKDGKYYKVINGKAYLDNNDPRNKPTQPVSSTWYDVDTALAGVYAQAQKLGVKIDKPSKSYGKSITDADQAQKILDAYVAQANSQISSSYSKAAKSSQPNKISTAKSGGGASAAKVGNVYNISTQIKNIQSTAKTYGVTLSGLSKTSYSDQKSAQSALDSYIASAQKAIDAKNATAQANLNSVAAQKTYSNTNKYGMTQSQWSHYQKDMGSRPAWQQESPIYWMWANRINGMGGGMPPGGADHAYDGSTWTPTEQAVDPAKLKIAQEDAAQAAYSAQAATAALERERTGMSRALAVQEENAKNEAKGVVSHAKNTFSSSKVEAKSNPTANSEKLKELANVAVNDVKVVKAGSNSTISADAKAAQRITDTANKAIEAAGKSNFLGMNFKSPVIDVDKLGQVTYKTPQKAFKDIEKFVSTYKMGSASVSKGSGREIPIIEKTALTNGYLAGVNGPYKTTSPVLYADPTSGGLAAIADKKTFKDLQAFKDVNQVAQEAKTNAAVAKAVAEAHRVNPKGSDEYFKGVAENARRQQQGTIENLKEDVQKYRDSAANVSKAILPDLESVYKWRDAHLSGINVTVKQPGKETRSYTLKDSQQGFADWFTGNSVGKGFLEYSEDEYNTLRNDPLKSGAELAATIAAGEVVGAIAGGAKVLTAAGGTKLASKIANPTAKYAADYIGKNIVDKTLIGSLAGSLASEAVPYNEKAVEYSNRALAPIGRSFEYKPFDSTAAKEVFKSAKEFAVGGYGFSKGIGIGERVTDKSLKSIVSTVESLKKIDAKYANALPSDFDVTRVSKPATSIPKSIPDRLTTLKKQVSKLENKGRAGDKPTIKALKQQINALQNKGKNANAVRDLKPYSRTAIKDMATTQKLNKELTDLRDMQEMAARLSGEIQPDMTKNLKLAYKNGKTEISEITGVTVETPKSPKKAPTRASYSKKLPSDLGSLAVDAAKLSKAKLSNVKTKVGNAFTPHYHAPIPEKFDIKPQYATKLRSKLKLQSKARVIEAGLEDARVKGNIGKEAYYTAKSEAFRLRNRMSTEKASTLVSGKGLSEKTLGEKRVAYARYKKVHSAAKMKGKSTAAYPSDVTDVTARRKIFEKTPEGKVKLQDERHKAIQKAMKDAQKMVDFEWQPKDLTNVVASRRASPRKATLADVGRSKLKSAKPGKPRNVATVTEEVDDGIGTTSTPLSKRNAGKRNIRQVASKRSAARTVRLGKIPVEYYEPVKPTRITGKRTINENGRLWKEKPLSKSAQIVDLSKEMLDLSNIDAKARMRISSSQDRINKSLKAPRQAKKIASGGNTYEVRNVTKAELEKAPVVNLERDLISDLGSDIQKINDVMKSLNEPTKSVLAKKPFRTVDDVLGSKYKNETGGREIKSGNGMVTLMKSESKPLELRRERILETRKSKMETKLKQMVREREKIKLKKPKSEQKQIERPKREAVQKQRIGAYPQQLIFKPRTQNDEKQRVRVPITNISTGKLNINNAVKTAQNIDNVLKRIESQLSRQSQTNPSKPSFKQDQTVKPVPDYRVKPTPSDKSIQIPIIKPIQPPTQTPIPDVSGVIKAITDIIPIQGQVVPDAAGFPHYQESENQIAYLYMRKKQKQIADMKYRKPKSQMNVNVGPKGNAKLKRTIFNKLGSLETMFGYSAPKKTTKKSTKRARKA